MVLAWRVTAPGQRQILGLRQLKAAVKTKLIINNREAETLKSLRGSASYDMGSECKNGLPLVRGNYPFEATIFFASENVIPFNYIIQRSPMSNQEVGIYFTSLNQLY